MKSPQPNGLVITKLQGTGNDFIFIDARTPLPGKFAQTPRPDLVRQLCDRNFGIGSDGMVFVEEKESGYRWDFFNTDGSYAEMCGNATRCFGRWAHSKLGLSEIDFETLVGKVKVTVSGDDVTSYLNFVTAQPRSVQLTLDSQKLEVFLLDTGVPHFVVQIEKLADTKKSQSIISALRFHPEAGPRGANVTFLEIVGEQKFKTVTFERGVEDFTLSCGTGVLAAAAVGLQIQARFRGEPAKLEAAVEAPGGKLKVKYGPQFKTVWLTGPAVEVFETTLPESVLTQEISR